MSIDLSRPDAPGNLTWQLVVFDGHVDVIRKNFATFEEGKAAGDALFELLSLAGRMDQFEYEGPRPDGVTRPANQSDDLPF